MIRQLSRRSGQGFVNCPTLRQSRNDRSTRDTCAPGPILDAHGLAIHGEKARFARVQNLLSARSPSAVVRRIRAVVVDAVDRMVLRWPRTHVGKKVSERVAPTFADENASASVVGIGDVVPVVAASVHGHPRQMFRRVCQTVRSRGANKSLAPKAATTPRSLSEFCSPDLGLCPTIALAQPEQLAVDRSAAQRNESAEALSGYVFSRTHLSILPRGSYATVAQS